MKKSVKIALISVGSVCGVALLTFGGFAIYEACQPSRDYNVLNPDGGFNRDVLVQKYDDLGSVSDYTEHFSAAEASVLAYTLFQDNEFYATRGVGTANASIVTQNIFSTQIRAGNEFFEESNSKSMFVNVAFRMYEEDGETIQYRGKVGDDLEDGVFSDEGVLYENDEYAEMMGRNVHSVETYIISNKTVLTGEKEASWYGETSFTKTASGYAIELELDPYLSVANYVRQMKTISNLAEYPYFYYVHLSFTLDKDLHLVELTTHEKYRAKLSSIIASDTEGSLTTSFYAGREEEIPLLNAPSFSL